MKKLRLNIEIIAEENNATILNIKAWTAVPIKPLVETPAVIPKFEEKLILDSTNKFNKEEEQELEHILAASADIIEASLKLHGNEFGA